MSTKKVFASSTLSLALAMGMGFTTLTVCATSASAQCTAGTNNVTSVNTTTQIYAALNNAANGTAALVTANATGMTSFQLAVLGLQSQWVADNGIYGAMAINSDLAASNMSAVLGKTCTSATVTVNAAGMSDEQLAVLVANLSKIDRIDGLESGKTLLVDANGVGAIVVNGAGKVRLSAAAALANTADIRGIACVLEFAPGFSVGNGGRLVAGAAQVSGIAIGGAGNGAVSIAGSISADADLSTIAAAVDFNGDSNAEISIAAGKTLTVKPSDANGKTVFGPGAFALSAAIGSSVDLRGVQASSSGLVIPGVDAGGTAILRIDQANGRSLAGAGTVNVDGEASAITSNASFRGVTTAGFVFSGTIGGNAVLSINAAQAGIAVSAVGGGSTGSVSILGTPDADTVNPSAVYVPVDLLLLGGNDAGTGTANADTMDGGDDNDTLNGGGGGDTMNGGAGLNTIDGGAGNDAAVIGGNYADATFTANGSTIVVSRNNGADVDTLSNVEEIRFSDKTVRIVGAGGYASLNAALSGAASDVMFVGASYAIDNSTPFATAADLAAIVARTVNAAGSSFAVNVAGMSNDKVAAINGNIGARFGFGAVAGAPYQIKDGATQVGVASSIQMAVDLASAGNTVAIPAGSHVLSTRLNIGKNIVIVGAGTGQTSIKSGIEQAGQSDPGGDNRGLIVVASGKSASFSDLTIDGNGKNVWQGVRAFGPVSFNGVAFTGIRYEWGGAGVYYQGTAIVAVNAGAVSVTNCSFTDIGRVGLLAYGTGTTATVLNSTFTGQGLGDRYNCAVETSTGASVSVQGSTVTNYRGTAVTGTSGDPSFAFYVVGSGSALTLTDNVITGNLFALQADAGTSATLHGNDLSQNTNGVVAGGSVVVDATCNWWGTTSESQLLALNPGATKFAPFRTSASDSACSGEGVAFVVEDGRSYPTIQAAHDATLTGAGDTIRVAAGNYSANLSISKRIVLDGAGSGTDGTVITSAASAAPVISVTGTGASATERLVIKDVRVTGGFGGTANVGSGIYLLAANPNTARGYITLENVTATGNSGAGVAVNGDENVGNFTDLRILSSNLSSNQIGIRVAKSLAFVNGLVVDGCTVNANSELGIVVNPDGLNRPSTGFVISNSSFSANGANATVYGSTSRYGNVNIGGFNGTLSMSNVQIDGGSGDFPADHGFSVGGYGSSVDAPSPAGTMSFSNVTITGKFSRPTGLSVNGGGHGRAFSIKNYSNVANVSFSGVVITNTYGNSLEALGLGSELNLGNTSFGVPSSAVNSAGSNPSGPNDGTRSAFSIVTGPGNSLATYPTAANATACAFASLGGSDADRFLAEGRVLGAVDASTRGLIRLETGKIFVPANVSNGLMNAVAAASSNDQIIVEAGAALVLSDVVLQATTKNLSIVGGFTVTSSSFASQAQLAAFVGRLAQGSSVSVNAAGMNDTQLAAVSGVAGSGAVAGLALASGTAAADITNLLARVANGSAAVNIAGMNADQVNAVNAALAKCSSVTGFTVRNLRGQAAEVVRYDNKLENAVAAAVSGDVVSLNAGTTYELSSWITVGEGVKLNGAGVTSVVDASRAPMNTASGQREQAILLGGAGSEVSNLKLVSPVGTRSTGTGAAYGIKSNFVASNVAIRDVVIEGVAMSAIDLNGVNGAVIERVSINGVSAGWGIALSGACQNVSISDVTVANAAWGEVAMQAYGSPLAVPTGVTFGGSLNFSAVTAQPAGVAFAFGPANSADFGYVANANVKLPAAFNRTMSIGSGASTTVLATRQMSVAGITAALGAAPYNIPSAAITVGNILGRVEIVRAGVAVAGRGGLTDAVATELVSGDVVQMNMAGASGAGIALTAAFPSTASIVGSFELGSGSFTDAAVLNSILNRASGASSRTVALAGMSSPQIIAVEARKADISVASGKIEAINSVDVSAIRAALNLADVSLTAYGNLREANRGHVDTDMIAIRPSSGGFADVAAATADLGKLVTFRAKVEAIIALNGDVSLADADMRAEGSVAHRFIEARDARLAIGLAALAGGETVTAEQLSATIAAYAARGTTASPGNVTPSGRQYLLNAMNAGTSATLTAVNAKAVAAFPGSEAMDILALGTLTEDNASLAGLQLALQFAAVGQITVNADNIGAAKLNAIALNATTLSKIGSITGTLAMDKDVLDYAGLAAKAASGAVVTVDASGMTDEQLSAVALVSRVDAITKLTVTNVQTDGELTALLSRCTPTAVGGTTYPVVVMNGSSANSAMNALQIAAVNGQLLKLGTVSGYTARVLEGAAVKHYNLKLDGSDGALAAAQVGQEVRLEAATFVLGEKLSPYRVTIRGAGMGSVVDGAVQGGTVIDISAVNTADRGSGIQLLGDGVALRDLAVTSPNRVGNTLGAGYPIAGSGPQADPNSVSRNVTIQNVRVHNVRRSALDLNTVVGGTVSNVVSSAVSNGYGLAVSGGSRDLQISDVTIDGAAWGDVAVWPWSPNGTANAGASETPSGISFGGGLNFSRVTVQPYNSVIAVSCGVADDFGYSGTAQVFVPASFNRSVSYGTGTNSTKELMRQSAVDARVTALATQYSVPSSVFAVANILGKVEILDASGVALKGRNVLENASAALAVSGNKIQVDGSADISLSAGMPSGVSVIGTLNIGAGDFDANGAVLGSLLAASNNAGCTRNVAVGTMSAAELVAFNGVRLSNGALNVSGQLLAVNNENVTDEAGILAALDIAGASHAAYDVISGGSAASLKAAVRADFLANRPYAAIPTALVDQISEFRVAENAVLTGAALAVTDLTSATGRYNVAGVKRSAVPAGIALAGISVSGAQILDDCANITQLSTAGREDIVVGLNGARTSLNAIHAAFVSAFPGALATDILLAGLSSSTDAANITLALSYAAPNTVLANVSGMNADQLRALAAGAAKLKTDGVTGTMSISSAITNWQSLLPKMNGASSSVSIDAEGMGASDLNLIAANAVRVDGLVNVAITNGNSTAQIAALMAGSGNGTMRVIGDGMSVEQLNAVVLGDLAKIRVDGVTGIAVLTDGVNSLADVLAKCAIAADVRVDAASMSATKLTAVVDAIARVDSINGLTVRADQSVAELAALLAKASDAVVIVDGMDAARLNAVADAIGGVKAGDGVRGALALSSAVTENPTDGLRISALLGKLKGDAVVAAACTGMSDAQFAALATKASQIAADGLRGTFKLGYGVPAWQSLLPKVATAAADAQTVLTLEVFELGNVGMRDGIQDYLNTPARRLVANNIARVDSILSLKLYPYSDDASGLTGVQYGQLLSVASDAEIWFASQLTAGQIAAVDANYTRVSVVFGWAVNKDIPATMVDHLMPKAATNVDVNALQMVDAQLASVSDAIGRGNNVGAITNLTVSNAQSDVQIGRLLGKATDAVVNADGMTDAAKLAAVSGQIGKVASITNLLLSQAQDSTQLDNLLSKAVGARVDASQMTAPQLIVLGQRKAKIATEGITGTFTVDKAVTNIADLMSKVADSATVTLDIREMTSGQIADANASVGLFDGSVIGAPVRVTTAGGTTRGFFPGIDGAVAFALDTNKVVVDAGYPLVFNSTPIPATPAFVFSGAFSVAKANLPSAEVLAAFLVHKGTSTVDVDLAGMSPSEVSVVAANMGSLDTVSGALAILNGADAAGMLDALKVARIDLAGYNALGSNNVKQIALGDTVANRGSGFASVGDAGTLFGKVVAFRAAAESLLTGGPIADADMTGSGRFAAARAALAAAGSLTFIGESVAASDMSTTVTRFAGLNASGKAAILVAMNAVRTTVTAVNNAADATYDYARGRDVISGGITSSTSQGNLELALAAAANGELQILATGMDKDQLNAIAGSAAKVQNGGLTGTILLTKDVTSPAVLAGLAAGGAQVDVNASGMSNAQLVAIAAIARVDRILSLTVTSAESDSLIASLLAKAVSATVEMGGMDPAQIASANGGFAAGKVGAVNGSMVRIKSGSTVLAHDLFLDTRDGFASFPGAVERANALKAANPSNAYSVEMSAGTFGLHKPITAKGVSLVGAGMGTVVDNAVSGGSVIDMSNAAVDGTYYPQGVLALGDGVVFEGFSLTSPNRSSGKGDRYGIKSSGPQGDASNLTTNLVIRNVRVHNTKMSALDMNTLVGGTIENVAISGASNGYGLAFSGGCRDVAVNGLVITGCAWGDVGVFPWRPSSEGGAAAGTADHTPSGISFGGNLGFTSINCQPYNSAISVGCGVSGDVGYDATANVRVPAAFNRTVSTVRTNTTNNSTLAMKLVTRQGDVAAVSAGLVNAGVFTFSPLVVNNILGPVEVLNAGVALAGRSNLDAALAAAVDGNVINVAQGTTVSLGAVIAKDVQITGHLALTKDSFATEAILSSLCSKASGATRSIDVDGMNAAKVAAVAVNRGSFTVGTVLNAVSAINAATAEGMSIALYVAFVDGTGFVALTYANQGNVGTDMVANRPELGFASVAAATDLFGKLVDFRAKAELALGGSGLADADMASGGRFVAFRDARNALGSASTVGESVSLTALDTTISRFAGLASSGKAVILSAMNGARSGSVTAMNAAANAAYDTALGRDLIAAGGLSNGTSIENLNLALAAANAGELDIVATDMGTAKLNAIGGAIGKIRDGGLSGTIALNKDVSNLSGIAGKAASNAVVNANAAGMSNAQLVVLSGLSNLNAVSSLTLTPAESNAVMSALLAKSVKSGSFPAIVMSTTGEGAADMNADQIGVVNSDVTRLGSVTGDRVRVIRAAAPAHYNLRVDPAVAVAVAGDEVQVVAGTFNLSTILSLNGVRLVGAGMNATVLDMSAVPMNTASGFREQGIVMRGNGAQVRNLTLQSPNRTAGTGSAYGIKVNPFGDGSVDSTSLLIENVKVLNVNMSAVDLNTAHGAVIRNLVAENVAAGYALSISGGCDGVTVDGMTAVNCVWGDVGVFPYPATNSAATPRPQGVVLGGALNIVSVNVQPYGSQIRISPPAGNAGHIAGAEVIVPEAFNRVVSTVRTRTSNGTTLAMNIATRQASVPAVAGGLVNGGGFTFSTPTVANILGPVEVLNAGVALAGRSNLDDAIAAAVDGNVINVAQGTAVSLGAVITKDISITGSVAMTKDSFANVAILSSLCSKASGASRTVDVAGMTADQVAAVGTNRGSFAVDTVLNAVSAINAANAAGMRTALYVAFVDLAGFDAMSGDDEGYTATDLVVNRGAGYASVAAATEFLGKLVDFRNAVAAAMAGAYTADAFGAAGVVSAAQAKLAALAGATVANESASAAELVARIANFNTESGATGRTYLLGVMNAGGFGSLSDRTAGLATGNAVLVAANAYNIVAGGLSASTGDDAEFTRLFGYVGGSSPVASTAVNAADLGDARLAVVSTNIAKVSAISGLSVSNAQDATQLGNLLGKASGALVSATGMNAAKLSAVGANAGSVGDSGVTGTLAIDKDVTGLAALLGKTATAATVNVDAAGMVAQLAVLSTNIAKVDAIANLSVSSAQDDVQLANLLGKASGALVDASGLGTASLNILVSNIGSIANDGITGTFSILSGVTDVGALLAKCSVAANVTVNASGMTSGQLSAVNANLAKVDALINVSAGNELTATELQNLMQNSTSVIVTATGMDLEKLNVLAAFAHKIAANGLLGTVALSKDVNNLPGLLAKAHPDATVNVDAAGMTPTQLGQVAAAIAAVDAISNLSLTSATVAADIDALLSKTSGAVANATGMSQAQLTKLGLRAASLAANGITGDVVYDATVGNAADLFGKIAVAANVTVNASGIDAAGLAFIDGQIAKVDVINGLQLTAAQDKDRMGRLLGKSSAASSYADGTGMSSNAGDQLAVLGDNSAKIANGGITGSFTVTGALTSAQLNGLLSKVFTGSSFVTSTTVTINASGMTNAQLSAIAGNIAAVDLINSLTVSASQSATELSALLGVAGQNQASVSASGMTSLQLQSVANAANGSNDPVAGITGTFTVDSSLSSAQIAALMSNTVAGQTQVTINTSGMSAAQQQAVFSTGVLVVKSQQSVKVGETVTIDIDVSGLPTTAVGLQASINYDASKLAFVQAMGGNDMPSMLYSTNTGSAVRLATGIAIGGAGSTPIVAGNLAKVQFTALVPLCSVTDCVSLTTSGFTNRIASSGAVSQPVPFVGTNLVNITALNALQLANVTADFDVAADAGVTSGAFLANPGVTAGNSCGPVPVVLTITLPGGGTTNSWPAMFPIGTSTVTWHAQDAANNVATSTKTYIVRDHQLATLDVTFSGVNSGNNAGFSHDVRVRLSDGRFVTRTLAFSRYGVGTVADVEVPVGAGYTCISVKDAAHTLAAVSTIPVVGTKYVPSAFVLQGGDANDDNIRDILDYGAFVFDYGGGKNPSSRSNYNRDGVVGTQDFTFISSGFLDVGADCGGGYANGGQARERVSVRDLRRAGMGDLAIADLNGDGWVDTKDVTLWMQGHRPAGYPTDEVIDAAAQAEN